MNSNGLEAEAQDGINILNKEMSDLKTLAATITAAMNDEVQDFQSESSSEIRENQADYNDRLNNGVKSEIKSTEEEILEMIEESVADSKEEQGATRAGMIEAEEEDKEFPDPATHASLTLLKAEGTVCNTILVHGMVRSATPPAWHSGTRGALRSGKRSDLASGVVTRSSHPARHCAVIGTLIQSNNRANR